MSYSVVLRWFYRGQLFHSNVTAPCPVCDALAIIRLPDEIRAEQPDDTTHVCHPLAGGCSHGFSDLPIQETHP